MTDDTFALTLMQGYISLRPKPAWAILQLASIAGVSCSVWKGR